MWRRQRGSASETQLACVVPRETPNTAPARSPTTTSRPLTLSRASTRFQSWRPRREMQLEEAANGFS